jgi:hypothetical protein
VQNKKGCKMQTNCTLFAKVVKNTRLKTYRVVFSFDAHNRITLRNAALATGDVANFSDSAEYVEHSVAQAIAVAKKQLSTDNIVML